MQDLFRFLLALAVLLFHYKHFAIQTALSSPPDDYDAPYYEILNTIYTHGYHAVAVFFFLSGYMLASKTVLVANPSTGLKNFLLKRLARIYPAHLVSLIFMGLLAITIDKFSMQPFMTYNDDFENFMASIFLLNGIGIMRDTSFNLPAWSLSVEAVCYLIFGGIIAWLNKQKASLYFIGLLSGAIINELFANPNTSNLGSGMVFFFAGALSAVKFAPWCRRHLPVGKYGVIILLAVSALSFSASLPATLGIQKIIWIFLSLPTLVVSMTIIDEWLNKIHERPLKWFGAISFSIYVWHFPVQAVLHYMTAMYYTDGTFSYNTLSLFWTYLALSFLVAQVSLLTIEKFGAKMINRLKTGN